METLERRCYALQNKINSLNAQLRYSNQVIKELKKLVPNEDEFNKLKDEIESLKEKNRLLIMEKEKADNHARYCEYLIKAAVEEKEKYHVMEIKQIRSEYEERIKDLEAQNLKLKSQVNKNSRNSSKPSSLEIAHPKIQNNRKKSGLKPGGQPGHKGHHSQKKKPTDTIQLETPDEIKNSGKYYLTGNTIKKQLVKISMKLEVIEYVADEYRERRTGRRYHAPFPKGLVNDVTYDASVKAFASLLHTHGNMSYQKVKEVLYDLSDGELDISCGTLVQLEKEFSSRTEAEREEIKKRMLGYGFAHVDGTTYRSNGKQENTIVFTSPVGTLLYARKHKGFKGIEGTAVEEYGHTLVHDGEGTFFHYGNSHQGCLVHELRYLLGSVENEPHLTWASKMRELMQEMIHSVNEAKRDGRTQLEDDEIISFEKRYDSILKLAEHEYELNPPNMKYYGEGKRIVNRLNKNKSSYLYFLRHIEVPATNNAAELVARKTKMHSKQSGGYRNSDYAQYYLDTLSVIISNGKGAYNTLLDVFSK